MRLINYFSIYCIDRCRLSVGIKGDIERKKITSEEGSVA